MAGNNAIKCRSKFRSGFRNHVHPLEDLTKFLNPDHDDKFDYKFSKSFTHSDWLHLGFLALGPNVYVSTLTQFST